MAPQFFIFHFDFLFSFLPLSVISVYSVAMKKSVSSVLSVAKINTVFPLAFHPCHSCEACPREGGEQESIHCYSGFIAESIFIIKITLFPFTNPDNHKYNIDS